MSDDRCLWRPASIWREWARRSPSSGWCGRSHRQRNHPPRRDPRAIHIVPPADPQKQPDITPDALRVLPCPCPRCGARMIVIEVFARSCEPRWRSMPSTVDPRSERTRRDAPNSGVCWRRHELPSNCPKLHSDVNRASPLEGPSGAVNHTDRERAPSRADAVSHDEMT